MKKLILSLVFVFATGTMMNANTTVVLSPECWDIAEIAVEEAQYYAQMPNIGGWPGDPLSMEEEFDVFAEAYDECEASGIYDEFQFPPFY